MNKSNEMKLVKNLRRGTVHKRIGSEAGKTSKTLLFTLVGASILLVLGALLLYFFVWSQPTREDYKNAQGSIKTLESSYASLTKESQQYLVQLNTARDVSATDAKAYNSAVSNHSTKISNLGSSKVMKDEDVKSAYESLVKKIPSS